jgi:Iap family predicted aminopeptidase
MRFYFILGYFIFYFQLQQVSAQADSYSIPLLKKHVQYLSSDELEGRATGSKGEFLANNYLKKTLSPRRSRILSWNYSIPADSQVVQSEMVGCFINNRAQNTVLIGAHIDHIGWGGKLSKSPGKKTIHNGADDNASGVALLIEIQHYLAQKKVPYNVLLIAFTGHEIGTKGSEYVSNMLPRKAKKIAYVLNFDMVGRMDPTTNKCYVSTNHPELFQYTSKDLLFAQLDTTRLALLDTKHWFSQSIPCATITTGMHNDYHKNSDDEVYVMARG